MKFTYNAYRSMIQLLKKNEFAFSGYNDYEKYTKVAILRHDIDCSIEKAVHFAELENAENVFGIYFILLSTDFYNICSLKSIEEIQKIQKLGASCIIQI